MTSETREALAAFLAEVQTRRYVDDEMRARAGRLLDELKGSLRAAVVALLPAPKRPPYRRNAHSEAEGMSLPVGKTCGDCIHIHRCASLFGQIADDETCDFAPSRFLERAS
jgi:hypothetical protein